MKANIYDLFLFFILIFEGTGLYTQFPGYSIILIIIVTFILVFDIKFISDISQYITKKYIYGVLLLIIFILIEVILTQIELINIKNISISIYMMIITYVYTKKLILVDINNKISIIILCTLLAVLIGQILQITNIITPINPDFFDYYNKNSEESITISILRPGGFLNSNNTAAIALCLLFAMGLSVGKDRYYLYLVAILVTLTIIILTQSRAGIIFLLLYLLKYVYNISMKRKTHLIFAIVLVVIVFNLFPEETSELLDNIARRFSGDDSSFERENIAVNAFNGFLSSPLFGNGDQYLIKNYGLSAHNQLLEILVSYGVFGFIIFIALFILFYIPCSWAFIIFCISPTMFFSHNFFDAFPLQVVLGLSLALDKYHININKRKI